MDNNRANILTEIASERDYQERKWGNQADDSLNNPNDFVAYITHYATDWFHGGFTPYPTVIVDDFRSRMIKVAALAVAAVESVDRQRAANGKTFYENAEALV